MDTGQTDTATSDFIIGTMMAVFGLIGLILAAGAVDSGIYVFGLCLAGFACLFNIGLIRAYYDRRDAARAALLHGEGAGHV